MKDPKQDPDPEPKRPEKSDPDQDPKKIIRIRNPVSNHLFYCPSSLLPSPSHIEEGRDLCKCISSQKVTKIMRIARLSNQLTEAGIEGNIR
jgi:hypothetical protein